MVLGGTEYGWRNCNIRSQILYSLGNWVPEDEPDVRSANKLSGGRSLPIIPQSSGGRIGRV